MSESSQMISMRADMAVARKFAAEGLLSKYMQGWFGGGICRLAIDDGSGEAFELNKQFQAELEELAMTQKEKVAA